ncbi:hypothetical protein GCM10023187_34570 [Nibrella viscosa]|uniref:Uncharacterized protein n=1 Tax=Nibrella viscosa TaxID=1084524 RepID=A0ABP8KMK9_9BACT
MTTFALFPTKLNGHATQPVTDQPIAGAGPEPATDTLVKRVNLHRYGYEKAEHHRGNAEALRNLFNQIWRGYLIDERSDDTRRQQQRQTIDQQILQLEKDADLARTEINKINVTDIPKLEQEIGDLEEQMLELRKAEAEGPRHPDHIDRFRLRFYWLLFLPLTLFVYAFYVSGFYSAFIRDLVGEAQAAGTNGLAGVMSTIFARSAFETLHFHWIAPFVFFAFGGFLHILADGSHRLRWWSLAGLLLVVLVADGLLAFFVEQKSHELKVLMGLADGEHHWWTSPVFYLIIVLGFVTCLIWSGILHALMHEEGKKDFYRITRLEIRSRQQRRQQLKARIQDLKARLEELEGTIRKIGLDVQALTHRKDVLVVSDSELEKYITDFYDGWLGYVNNRLGNEALRIECETVRQAFYQEHLRQFAAGSLQ